MSSTCAYDGATYPAGGRCPKCGADNPRPAMPARLAAQLDLDGTAHEIAPETRQERLFTPDKQLDGQSFLNLDGHTADETP